jgi:hypothetical protein
MSQVGGTLKMKALGFRAKHNTWDTPKVGGSIELNAEFFFVI